MKIGQVMQHSGASAKAIRHYEAIGLLGPIARRGAYRCYTEQDVAFVQLIRQAQAVGLSLAQLRGLRRADGSIDWPAVAQRVRARDAEVAAEQARLAAQRAKLATVLAEIEHCLESGVACPAA